MSHHPGNQKSLTQQCQVQLIQVTENEPGFVAQASGYCWSHLVSPGLSLQLRSALDHVDELELSNSHLTKRLEKMKANRSALLAQQ